MLYCYIFLIIKIYGNELFPRTHIDIQNPFQLFLSVQFQYFMCAPCHVWDSLVAQRVKSLPAMQKTWIQSLSGRPPGEENGNPLQYSCLENPVDKEAWWATVDRVTKSQIGLSDFTFTFHAMFKVGIMEFRVWFKHLWNIIQLEKRINLPWVNCWSCITIRDSCMNMETSIR